MRVLRSLLISDDDETVFRLSMWLSNDSKLLERLRDLQMMLDPIGVLDNDKNDENFRAAMTLRDCTVFIRLPKEEEEWHLAEARIGDLDLKSPDKAGYWKETERALIDEGWYAGTERLSDQQPMTCLLSPDRDSNVMERNFPIPYRANERRHYSR
jgi:inositol-pentakisphosphate 2-kinase